MSGKMPRSGWPPLRGGSPSNAAYLRRLNSRDPYLQLAIAWGSAGAVGLVALIYFVLGG